MLESRSVSKRMTTITSDTGSVRSRSSELGSDLLDTPKMINPADYEHYTKKTHTADSLLENLFADFYSSVFSQMLSGDLRKFEDFNELDNVAQPSFVHFSRAIHRMMEIPAFENLSDSAKQQIYDWSLISNDKDTIRPSETIRRPADLLRMDTKKKVIFNINLILNRVLSKTWPSDF
jgi:hypothetical protein